MSCEWLRKAEDIRKDTRIITLFKFFTKNLSYTTKLTNENIGKHVTVT